MRCDAMIMVVSTEIYPQTFASAFFYRGSRFQFERKNSSINESFSFQRSNFLLLNLITSDYKIMTLVNVKFCKQIAIDIEDRQSK